MSKKFFLCMLLFPVLFSCSRTADNTEDAGNKKVDSLKSGYQVLQDSLNIAWEEMMQDDNEKIADLKRLLDEIQYTNLYNKQEIETLYAEVENLKTIRYDSMTMADSDGIDRYDSATAEVSYKVSRLAIGHPKFESYPLMQTLIDDISDANDKVLLYRVRYDNYAQAYNEFVEEHRSLMPQIDSSATLKPRPVFQLITP